MARFADIPMFPRAHWACDIEWSYLENHIETHREYGLDLEPDFQRAHVWTEAQQIAYVEYMLRGGEVARTLTFNAVGWTRGIEVGDYVIVDGKQRLEAVRRFMRNELPVFGATRSQYTDRPRMFTGSFKWQVCELPTRRELLELYLNINAGGTPHTAEEIERVRAMIGKARDEEYGA